MTTSKLHDLPWWTPGERGAMLRELHAVCPCAISPESEDACRVLHAQGDDAHLAALDRIMDQPYLSVPVLLKAHDVLMLASNKRSGFRTSDHAFLPKEDVPLALQAALARYPANRPTELVPALVAAGRLFRDVAFLVRPFEEGNGRMGRMLIAWAMRPSLGFTLPLVDGSENNEKHYDAVVSRMARHLDAEPSTALASYILQCAHFRIACFANAEEARRLAISGSMPANLARVVRDP